MPSSSGMTIYRNRLGQFRTLNIWLESFWSHCLVVTVQFLGHSGPSSVSAALSSGHLDPLTIPLSFFRESKAVLASTIIFVEDTSCCQYSVSFVRPGQEIRGADREYNTMFPCSAAELRGFVSNPTNLT